MIRPLEALRVNLVNFLGSRRARGEPTALGQHLQPADLSMRERNVGACAAPGFLAAGSPLQKGPRQLDRRRAREIHRAQPRAGAVVILAQVICYACVCGGAAHQKFMKVFAAQGCNFAGVLRFRCHLIGATGDNRGQAGEFTGLGEMRSSIAGFAQRSDELKERAFTGSNPEDCAQLPVDAFIIRGKWLTVV